MKLSKSKLFYVVLSAIPMLMVSLAPTTAAVGSLFWVHVPKAPKYLQ